MIIVWLTTALGILALLFIVKTGRFSNLINRWRRFQHYRRQINKIPGVRSFPLIGTTWVTFMKKRAEIPAVIQRNHELFPRLARTWLGPAQALVHIKRAEHMEIVLGSSTQHTTKAWSYDFVMPWLGDGLLTANGEHWRQHRKIITPTFHFGILETFGEIFAEKSTILADKLEAFAISGKVVDVYPLVTLAALDIIAEAAMGCEVSVAQSNLNMRMVTYCSFILKRFTLRTKQTTNTLKLLRAWAS